MVDDESCDSDWFSAGSGVVDDHHPQWGIYRLSHGQQPHQVHQQAKVIHQRCSGTH